MSSNQKKPRICIALPGINYYKSTAYVLNTEPLLTYLEKDFEVTVVFRKTVEKPVLGYRFLTILDVNKITEKEKQQTDANFSATGLFGALKYMNILNKFVHKNRKQFDLVIEKQWSLVGCLSTAFQRYNVPGIFIVEAEFYTTGKAKFDWKKNPVKQASTMIFKQLLPHLREKWIQKSNGIIVETEQMKSFLIENSLANSSKKIYPIPNGINPEIFFPRDRQSCREKLGISQEDLILTYVGSLNRFIQEPGPIIEALGNVKPPNVFMHIIGDGKKQKELEKLAEKYGAAVKFHGRLSQQEASLYMGSANICVAPYNRSLFPGGNFTSASLKVCEYLACGRLVISIPCERMEHLLDGGGYGFLVENNRESYQEFFQKLPDIREILEKENNLIRDLNNSTLKNKEIVMTWKDIAEMYKIVIEENLSLMDNG
ncbi:glycosyltransferase [Dapis sp. BLCC M229]|uniref:glycosyltransferase n=1 Tax=Dapis sp. BLCC M229 TaxID=3400188 RepID=UPI003CF569B6